MEDVKWRVAYHVEGGEPDRFDGVRLCRDRMDAERADVFLVGQTLPPVDVYDRPRVVVATEVQVFDGDEWVTVRSMTPAG